MSFRTKVMLSITATVVLAVWIIAGVVSALVTKSFERRDAQRTAALVSQFRREFDRRGVEVERRIEIIANSDPVARIAVNLGDPSAYYDVAQTLAREQSLDALVTDEREQTVGVLREVDRAEAEEDRQDVRLRRRGRLR